MLYLNLIFGTERSDNREIPWEVNMSRTVMPSLSKENAVKVLTEVEGTIAALRRCFMAGSFVHGERTLSMDNLGELLQYIAAYYSWTVTLWGNAKSMYETAEQKRKLEEGNAFVDIKRGSKVAVKEAEAEAAGKVESYIDEEMDWRLVFNRANACRMALESFLKTVDSLKYIRTKEWNSAD